MISQQKVELRKKISLLKGTLSEKEKLAQSEKIFEKIETLEEFVNSEVVLIYWSMDDEVNTHYFIEKWWKRKTLLLPTVAGKQLKLKQYTGLKNMQPGPLFSILEPLGKDFTQIEKIDLIIVPGVAFDKDNNRLGRGKAYYDKLLGHTRALKIGVGFNVQLCEKVPMESHDLPLDKVVFS